MSIGLKRKEKRQENIAGLELLGLEQQMDVLGKNEGRYVDETGFPSMTEMMTILFTELIASEKEQTW